MNANFLILIIILVLKNHDEYLGIKGHEGCNLFSNDSENNSYVYLC